MEDSFGCSVSITGKGLKDLVVNYQFVFDVTEIDRVSELDVMGGTDSDGSIEILPPEQDSPEIGVIDSGIMEHHQLIEPAIKPSNSKSYLGSDASTADYVSDGGHGTKVAGMALYPNGIPSLGSVYKLPFFIRNIRVLDKDNALHAKYPAKLMEEITQDHAECTVYNLSITSYSPFRVKHMSSWAAALDKLIHEREKLFVVAVGNLMLHKIKHYLLGGKDYPKYFEENFPRIANPAQSLFSLSVGSINPGFVDDLDWQSIGSKDQVSAFSRIGLGIWDSIKPDVVEYGGGVVVSKSPVKQVKGHPDTTLETVRSTYHGGRAIGTGGFGTSFATPKVTHIAGLLSKVYPNETVNLIRALIVQGARLPGDHFRNPTKNSIRFFGYGVPNLERCMENSKNRVTFYGTRKIQATEGHVFSLKLPEGIRKPDDEYDILIEVTLAYSAKVRRTRRLTKSYLGTWLDWTSSYLSGESLESFKARSIKGFDDLEAGHDEEDENVIPWMIRERSNWGNIPGVNRNRSTIQKDWAIIKSHALPEELSFAIKAHKGWDKTFEAIPYAFTVSIEALEADLSVYNWLQQENTIEEEEEV
jgi:hypothetical protein